MRHPRHTLPSEFVHVVQRGLGRRIIFEDDDDRRRYLVTLKAKTMDCNVSVLAWVLMENHTHLLVKSSSASLSRAMQRIGVSYAQYFNGRHGHVGKLFQNRFSSEPIASETHLLAAIRYIHRNPEAAKIASVARYPWSSYRELAGEEKGLEGKGICDVASVRGIFGGVDEFKSFHGKEEVDEFVRLGSYRPRMNDHDACEIARRRFGPDFADSIASMPKIERDRSLRFLKESGLSIRQIERLTGIGRGPITTA